MTVERDLIITIVNKGYSDYVVDAARDAGARGSTILHGRGTSGEKTQFMGISLQDEKSIVLTLVKRTEKKKIMAAIAERTSLNVEGRGFCFSMPVNDVVGVNAETSERPNKKDKTVTKKTYKK